MINNNSAQTYANDSNVKEISTLLNSESEGKPLEKPDDGDITPPETLAALDSEAIPDAVAPQPGTESSDPQTEPTEHNEHVSLKDLADTLDVDAKDLYDVQIPIGADKVATLGDLKDSFKKFEVMQKGQADFEDNKTRSENEMMIARRQIESLVQLGAKSGALTPELVDMVDKQHLETVNRERNALYNVIPEWKDNTTRQTDLDAIVNVMSSYGFSRNDVESVLDHRLLKFVHDMTKRTNMISDARKKQAVPKNTGKHSRSVSPSKSALQQRIATAKKGSQTQKIDAISTLIN